MQRVREGDFRAFLKTLHTFNHCAF